MLEIKTVRMEFPADANIIVGQAHFIKTVEDLYEAVSTTVPQAKFGVAFNESSGACLTRADGNEEGLRDIAIRNAQALGCGHTFVLIPCDDKHGYSEGCEESSSENKAPQPRPAIQEPTPHMPSPTPPRRTNRFHIPSRAIGPRN